MQLLLALLECEVDITCGDLCPGGVFRCCAAVFLVAQKVFIGDYCATLHATLWQHCIPEFGENGAVQFHGSHLETGRRPALLPDIYVSDIIQLCRTGIHR